MNMSLHINLLVDRVRFFFQKNVFTILRKGVNCVLKSYLKNVKLPCDLEVQNSPMTSCLLYCLATKFQVVFELFS